MCSTSRTPGRRPRGSAPRPSRTRSTSGSTRRSWPRPGRSSSSRRAHTAAAARSSSRRSATCSGPGRSCRSTWSRCATTTRRTPASRISAGARRPTRTSSPTCGPAPRGSRRSSSSTRTTRRRTSRPSSPCTPDLVRVGGYLIVEDSNIGRIRNDLLPPLEAIETFLSGTDAFEIDRRREKFLITFNPSGYLRRALGAELAPQRRVRRGADDADGAVHPSQSTSPAAVPSATRLPASSIPGWVKT